MQLLRPSDDASIPQVLSDEVEMAPVLSEVPPEKEKTLRCYTLGPFSEEAALQDLKKHLSEQVDDLKVRRREEREAHRYWVYLPPLQNRQQAIATSKALARQKVKDYYIVRSGENNNAISLGHFREKVHADRRLKKLGKLGFDVDMKVIYRQYSLFWLDYSVASAEYAPDALIEPYLVNGAARLDRECE